MQLRRFDVLRWDDPPTHTQRVIWIDTLGDRAATIDIVVGTQRRKLATPQWQSLLDIEDALQSGVAAIIVDPYHRSVRDDDLTDAQRTRRDAMWEIIRPLLYTDDGAFRVEIIEPAIRGLLIRHVVQTQRTIHEPWLRTMLTRALQGYCAPNDVLPRYANCGQGTRKPSQRKLGRPNHLTPLLGDNGINLSPGDLDQLKRAFSLYERGRLASLSKAHQWYIERYQNCGYRVEHGVVIPQLPPADEFISLERFTKLYQNLRNVVSAQVGRAGQHAYDTKLRPNYGQGRERLRHPGHMYLDATIPKCWLVSAKDSRYIIGRPVLYIAVNEDFVFGGFAVLLAGPSYEGAMMVLDCMNRNKVELCAAYNIVIDEEEWPWEGLPEAVGADRAELLSIYGDRWVIEPHIGQATAASFRPDWKWMVEGGFNLLERAGMDDVPGVPDTRDPRQGSAYIYEAALTMFQFCQLVICLLLDLMASHELSDHPLSDELLAQGIDRTPINLYKYRMTHYGGVPRRMDQETLRKLILPKGRGTIHQRRGIYVHQLYYTCDRAIAEGWFVPLTGRRNTLPVDVLYDPRLVDAIYVRRPGEQEWTHCQLRHDFAVRYAGLSFAEVAALRRRSGQASLQLRTQQYRSRAKRNARVEHIKAAAKARKEAHTAEVSGGLPTKASRRDPAHRVEERRTHRQVEAFIQAEQPAQPSDTPAAVTQRAAAQERRRQRMQQQRIPETLSGHSADDVPPNDP